MDGARSGVACVARRPCWLSRGQQAQPAERFAGQPPPVVPAGRMAGTSAVHGRWMPAEPMDRQACRMPAKAVCWQACRMPNGDGWRVQVVGGFGGRLLLGASTGRTDRTDRPGGGARTPATLVAHRLRRTLASTNRMDDGSARWLLARPAGCEGSFGCAVVLCGGRLGDHGVGSSFARECRANVAALMPAIRILAGGRPRLRAPRSRPDRRWPGSAASAWSRAMPASTPSPLA